MKSVFNIVFILLLSTCYLIYPSSAATIAHWKFDDPQLGAADGSALPDSDGQTVWRQAVTDYSGNGNHLTTWEYAWAGFDWTANSYSGDLGIVATGSYPAAMTWSEQSSPVGIDLEAWNPAQFTIEAVFTPSEDGFRTIVGRDGTDVSSSNSNAAPLYFQQIPNWGVAVKFADNAGNRYEVISPDDTISQGIWYHMAAVSDGTTLTLFLKNLTAGTDYQVLGTVDLSGSSDSSLAIGNGGGSDWEPGTFTVGRGLYEGIHQDRFLAPGVIDEVAISDVALQPGQFVVRGFVTVTESEGITILFSGDTVFTDSYDIVLTDEPMDNVIITVTPPQGISLGNGSGQSRYLTFTDQDWDQPQTVTLQITDPHAVFNTTELITHTTASNDLSYNNISVPDIVVYIQDESCGIWGYLESDYNFDCNIDLQDFALMSSAWLTTEVPADIDDFALDWLLSTFSFDSEIYDRSIKASDTPIFINTANVLNTIDEKVYGHFLEHIYHSANGGLWGDLIWNRSFELNGSGTASWSIDGDQLVQASLATDVHMEFGDDSWTDYELKLQARKDSGNEGFLIIVRAPDSDNFYWLNLGGWGNSQHGIEQEQSGTRTVVGSQISGSITSGVWYDITVRCEGNNIQVWLDQADGDPGDDPQIFNFTDTGSPYLSGSIGLGTWQTQASFRNIQVTDLSGSTVLYSGLPTIQGSPFGAEFWTIFGTASAQMSDDALNDDYSVEITSDGTQTGLQQDNFAFKPQPYTGSLWMKGTMPAGVRVQLLDGQTVLGYADLAAPTANWVEYPFSITPNASTDDGSLRIVLLGSGTVNIDQVSMMGQDSIDTGGYRPDLLAAVEELRPPVIRWPGGCFASLYFWKDAIGPQHTRTRFSAYMWEDQDTNSYGTDEFIQMCEKIGSEPIICINTGVLDSACGEPAQWMHDDPNQYLRDALDWMEYCNGDAQTTTWGAVRAANGHPAPYNVRYWEIDNETWDAGSAAYIAKVIEFAPALQAKAVELNFPIELMAVGAGGFSQDWNQDIINSCANLIDYISVHFYDSPNDYKTGPADYEDYLITLAGYIAGSSNPDLKIYNSEWNAQSTDWRTGLFAGGLLNVYERQGENFKIGGPALFLRHTSAGDWDNAFINFDHTGWFPAPNYVVMRLWHDHYSPNLVETVAEGTNTDLNIASTLSDDAQTLNIQIVNADAEDQSVEFEIDGTFVPETAYMHYVAPGDLYARNTLEDTDVVKVQAKVLGIDGQNLRFNVPAYSAMVVTVQAAQP